MKYLGLCLSFCFLALGAQTEKNYNTGHGGTVRLPFGDISFADSVVFYQPGVPTPVPQNLFPEDALGKPDFNEARIKGFVSLGTGGQLVLAFRDNALVNVPGIDLYVLQL